MLIKRFPYCLSLWVKNILRVHQILTSLYTLFFETGLINGYPYLFPLHGCYKVLLRSSGSIQKTAEVSIVFQRFFTRCINQESNIEDMGW